MKVFVAERNVAYEGSTIIGVFTNKQKAQKCCDNDFYQIEKNNHIRKEKRGDSYTIEEHEVF